MMTSAGAFDPAAMRARADTFRALARSWTEMAEHRSGLSAGRLRRSAAAALFAALLIDELLAGDAVERRPAPPFEHACARSRAAVAQAHRLQASWERREHVRLGPRRAPDALHAQLTARKRRLRESEASVEWLEASAG